MAEILYNTEIQNYTLKRKINDTNSIKKVPIKFKLEDSTSKFRKDILKKEILENQKNNNNNNNKSKKEQNQTTLLEKRKEKTSDKFGKAPKDRTVEELFEQGIIVLDKHSGPTSHSEIENLKKSLKMQKAGHSGTLDPKVTGVLLTGLGKATRLMEYMLKSNKEYVCLMYLHSPITLNQLKEATKDFTGVIKQTPPIISAVKRQEREREIYSIEILDTDKNQEKIQNVLFRVKCQHGTYIRKLCTDMAEHMGIKGQMKELRRTKAGPFDETQDLIGVDKIRNLYELYQETKDEKEKQIFEKELKTYIKPMELALKEFKKVYVSDSCVNNLTHGCDLAVPGVIKLEENIQVGEEIAILTQKGELIAMGMAYLNSKQVMKKKKGAFIKTSKVFMDIGTYPEFWQFTKPQKEE